MRAKKISLSANDLVFFITVWLFYSLNSGYFQVPHAMTLRWVCMAALIYLAVRKKYGKIPMPPSIIPVFLLATIPSLFATINMTESVVKIVCFVIVIYGYYIYFSSFDSIDEYERAFKIITIVMIAFHIQSILAILMGVGYDGNRAIGITTNANTLGGYSNLAFLAAFYWHRKTVRLKKIFFLAMMITAVWTCILSGSRGGFAAMCIILAWALFLGTKGIFRILAVLLVVLGGYCMLTGKLAFLNITALNRLTEEGGTDRGELWEYGINIWRQHPIFGCGYQVSNMLNRLSGSAGMEFHNSYLTILAEIGVWGVCLLGGVLLSRAVKIIGFIRRRSKIMGKNVMTVCGLMMVTQLIAAYSESFLFAPGSTEACIFWMLFSWSWSYINLCNRCEVNWRE